MMTPLRQLAQFLSRRKCIAQVYENIDNARGIFTISTQQKTLFNKTLLPSTKFPVFVLVSISTRGMRSPKFLVIQNNKVKSRKMKHAVRVKAQIN